MKDALTVNMKDKLGVDASPTRLMMGDGDMITFGVRVPTPGAVSDIPAYVYADGSFGLECGVSDDRSYLFLDEHGIVISTVGQ